MATINDEKDQEAVRQAQLKLRQQMGSGYQSQWQDQLDDTMQRIMNREKFTYDLNGDALYKQYKDQYITGGRMAMMDTMGQAAALTGGYGNSYAQGVGQQAYQGYLQGLNDKIPELYQLAMNQYQAEGDALMDQYGLLADRDADDYAKYQDRMDLVQPQVLEMLAAGVMPSDDMIAASGLSPEYINAMFGNLGTGADGDGRWYVDESSDWFANNESADGWLGSKDGRRWQNTREGIYHRDNTVIPGALAEIEGGTSLEEAKTALKNMGYSQSTIDELDRRYRESKGSGE